MNYWLDSDTLKAHSLDGRQFMDFRESTLTNGMRIIEAYNSSGLTFTLLPDRGMDIWSASYNGMPLTWISPNSPHPSDYGQSWLRLFNGGLLTTCGLTHVGPPEKDSISGEQRDLHGNYTRTRASRITFGAHADTMHLSCAVHEGRLFGEELQLTRTITLQRGLPEIHLRDVVTNLSDMPQPLMVLYHCNLGYPLIQEGAQMVVASDVYPRDDTARSGAKTWDRYEAATPAYAEQVFFHHVKQNASQQAFAAVLNDTFGIWFEWQTETMPYLTQWKNTRQGSYVCGIEPGNCIPEGQNAARDAGRLVMLAPGESQAFHLRLSIIDGADAIRKCRERIAYIQNTGSPVEQCNLSGYQKFTEQN